MKVLVYGYGLMGKKVAHAVMNDADLELAGVVSPVFDVQPEVPAYKSLDEYRMILMPLLISHILPI